MAETTDLIDRVERLLRDRLNLDLPSRDTDLIETGLLDSLALVELLYEIEQEFHVEIPLDELELEHLRTVEAVAASIARIGAASTTGTA
jgi:acyl carrier protein